MNKICKLLGIRLPIIQEPVHTLTNGKLISSISETGALGILGINAGYQYKPDISTGASITNSEQIGTFKNNFLLDAMQERNLMNEQIDYVLANSFRPFAIEIATTSNNPQLDHTAMELLKLMRKRRLTIALFEGFGKIASKEWIQLLHKNGITVMQVINNIIDFKKACANNIDIIICRQAKNLRTFINEAGAIPILWGADSANPHILKQALDQGAQGVYLKSVFTLAKEAPTSAKIKNLAVKAIDKDLVNFRINTSSINSLPGKLPNKLAQLSNQKINPKAIYRTAHGYQGLINGMVKGDLTNGFTDIPSDIHYITDIQPVAKIISNIINFI